MTTDERLDRLELENRRLRRSLTGIVVLSISAFGCLFLTAADKKTTAKPSGKKSKNTIDTSKYESKPRSDKTITPEDSIVTKRLVVGDPDGAHIVLMANQDPVISMISQDRKRRLMITEGGGMLSFQMIQEGQNPIALSVSEAGAEFVLGDKQKNEAVILSTSQDGAAITLAEGDRTKASIKTIHGQTWLSLFNGVVRLDYPTNKTAVQVAAGYYKDGNHPSIDLFDGEGNSRVSLYYDQKFDVVNTVLSGKNGNSRLSTRLDSDSPKILFMNEDGEKIQAIEPNEPASKAKPSSADSPLKKK